MQIHRLVNSSSQSKQYRSGFFGSQAPPLFRQDSWDVTSQIVYAVKHRGWVTKLVTGVALLPVNGRAKTPSLFWCTQSNTRSQVTDRSFVYNFLVKLVVRSSHYLLTVTRQGSTPPLTNFVTRPLCFTSYTICDVTSQLSCLKRVGAWDSNTYTTVQVYEHPGR